MNLMYVCYAAWALKRGFLTAKAARPDVYRAANNILRMALEGRLCLCLCPPSYTLRQGQWRCSYIFVSCDFLFGLLMSVLFSESLALFAKDQMYMYTLQIIISQIFSQGTCTSYLSMCRAFLCKFFCASFMHGIENSSILSCVWPKLQVWLVGCVYGLLCVYHNHCRPCVLWNEF